MSLYNNWKTINLIPSGFKYVKSILFLLYTCFSLSANSQDDPTYSFLVAGHAYGAHAGVNIGLHPPFLKKLFENRDSSVMAVFLTGDIVNQSTNASWNQVKKELSGLGLNSYYVMGNHDNNSLGHTVFKEKHGGDYYYFTYKNELYIILNSTESNRSISQAQLQFIDDIFSNTDAQWERAFIFFHEVIWNSNIKYKLVRSNSRSRYSSLVNISNFWNEVYPRFTAQPDKKFYLFAGDVGGNPDAIAASYDVWENVTLLSSGMGEVKDENFMKVNVLPDSVTFELIPLNVEVEMKPITWYNIPEKPDTIIGPATVFPPQADVNYQVSPVINATSYSWILSNGITGTSDSAEIYLRFDDGFKSGKISVLAVNDGFGESEPKEMQILIENSTFISENKSGIKLEVLQNHKNVILNFNSDKSRNASLRIYDQMGRIISNTVFSVTPGINSKKIEKNNKVQGLAIIELLLANQRLTKIIILN